MTEYRRRKDYHVVLDSLAAVGTLSTMSLGFVSLVEMWREISGGRGKAGGLQMVAAKRTGQEIRKPYLI
jgi:hypothetical protein